VLATLPTDVLGYPNITCPVRQTFLTQKLYEIMTFRTKLFCVMKLTTMIMLAGCLQVSAHVHSQKLSYKARNAPLEEVLVHIKQQTGYLFIYNDRDIVKAWPVTVSLKDVTVETALKEVFKEQPLTYEVRGIM
jgi:hypothetical protein